MVDLEWPIIFVMVYYGKHCSVKYSLITQILKHKCLFVLYVHAVASDTALRYLCIIRPQACINPCIAENDLS